MAILTVMDPKAGRRQEGDGRSPSGGFRAGALLAMGIAMGLWVPAAIAQPVVPFPSTNPGATSVPPSTPPTIPSSSPPTTYSAPPSTFSAPPPSSTPPPIYPSPYSPGTIPPAYGAPTGTYPPNPYAPTFQPSTAPTGTMDGWMSWLGFPPSNPAYPYSQPPIPTGFGQPVGQPVGTVPGMPTTTGTFPGYPMGTAPTGMYPPSVYPNTQPPVMYPGTGSVPNPYAANPYAVNPYTGYPPAGGYPPNPNWWTSTTTAVQTQAQQTIRLCQGFRFRYTYVPGNSSFDEPENAELASNDFEGSFVFACPKFLGCSQPLFLMPAYAQHLWDGPTVPGTDVPGSAFSAFLDSSWETDPMQTWGGELGLRIGVFSDFNAVNSDSLRYQGKAIARLRLTPNSTARGGVYYIDRVKVKMLPAFGVLWVPNPDTRWDLFFPEPKLSHYLTTHGDKDVWWYLTAHYGGGSWTVEQVDGSDDEMDINDVRVLLGFECGKSDLLRQGFRTSFFEVGYVFDRELVYRFRPSSDIALNDSLVFRMGFGY